MKPLNADYWEDRYANDNTPWDIGAPSPSLMYLAKTYIPKEASILIPGAGQSKDALQLWEWGYKNIWICDWAASAMEKVKTSMPQFPESQLLVADFFNLKQSFHFILEQTFFCAIDRSLRPAYVDKTAELLLPQGILCGLFFAQEMPGESPPHGGSKEEYLQLFQSKFDVLEMEISPHSIKPRKGAELLFRMQKKPDF